MTFLEFVAHELLGPPKGRASWNCPYCDPNNEMEWASFSVRPPLNNYPIKFRCHRCHRWGDEHDLLNVVYPGEENRDARRIQLSELKSMYLRDYCSPLGDIT